MLIIICTCMRWEIFSVYCIGIVLYFWYSVNQNRITVNTKGSVNFQGWEVILHYSAAPETSYVLHKK